jgi:glutamate racemase
MYLYEGVTIVIEQKDKPIGVIDSGLGGLTVLRELERLLPDESIVYFGDNANCPYGNRPRREILHLSASMLDFLRSKDIKIAAIACNTISALADELREKYEFPIVSIIEAASEYAANLALSQVGIFATEFTINNGAYKTLIGKLRPQTQVFGQPSRTLAALIDEGRFYDGATKDEVSSMINSFSKAHPEVKHIVLGCTHYPIVQDLFEEAGRGYNFINPAFAQAKAVESALSKNGLLSSASKPRLDIFTSGERPIYDAAIKKLEIKREAAIISAFASATAEAIAIAK